MRFQIPGRLTAHLAVWAGTIILSGCLGGGGDNPIPTASTMPSPLMAIPVEATTSLQELFRYQASVNSSTAAAQDMAEPIDVSSLVLPTSETAEPFDV